MKKLLSLLLFLGLSASGFAQDTTKEFQVKGFDKLDIGSAFVIHVKQADNFRVIVKGQVDDVADLVAKVVDGQLSISYKREGKPWKSHRAVSIDIDMPKLRAAEFSGASKAKVLGFNTESLNIGISGASSATFEVDARIISADCSGASSLVLVGKGEKANFDISGASHLDALGFSIGNAAIDASGASSAKIYALNSLAAEASGASSVKYKGDASVKASTSGASSVRRLN